MKYLILVAMMGIGSAMAFADDQSVDNTARGRVDVEYSCHFRSPSKKGVTCRAEGEVSVRVGETASLDRRFDDDNRLNIVCSDGYRDFDRARAEIRNDRDGEDLIIRAIRDNPGDFEDRMEIELPRAEEIAATDRDRDDDRFRASLTRDNSRARFFGSCRLHVERHEERPTMN